MDRSTLTKLWGKIKGLYNELNTKLAEVETIAKGANRGRSFQNYQELVDSLNSENATSSDDSDFKYGDNLYVRALEVPDLWVAYVDSSNSRVNYNYTTDEKFIEDLYREMPNGGLHVGIYYLSALETQKVDLTSYIQDTDYATDSKSGVLKTDSKNHGTNVTEDGVLTSQTKSYQDYDSVLDSNAFVSKGTLENVIEGKGLVDERGLENAIKNSNRVLSSFSSSVVVTESVKSDPTTLNNYKYLRIKNKDEFDSIHISYDDEPSEIDISELSYVDVSGHDAVQFLISGDGSDQHTIEFILFDDDAEAELYQTLDEINSKLNNIPIPTLEDVGKVLVVNEQGKLEYQELNISSSE